MTSASVSDRRRPRVNPYADLDWGSVQRVASASHMHIDTQADLDNGYKHGVRHFPISDYYPSAPRRADTRLSDFTLRQSWPVRVGDRLWQPPVNWNDIVTWRDEVAEPDRNRLPFTETEPMFSGVPDDVILSSNAEHHGFTNTGSHICCPGSSFASGNVDVRNRLGFQTHGVHCGFDGTWQEAFTGMIDALDYQDAGGITINHPTWFSALTDESVYEMLDFDRRVLGIEIYNDYSATKRWFDRPGYVAPAGETEQGFSLGMWDRVLSSGRRCWGFCVPDHGVRRAGDWQGRCILLAPALTEVDCLRCYRSGAFYGCLLDNGLTVTDFSVSDDAISLGVSRSAEIALITAQGRIASQVGERARFPRPDRASGDNPVFARIEVRDETGERLFLQPIMF